MQGSMFQIKLPLVLLWEWIDPSHRSSRQPELFDVPRAVNIVIFDIGVPNWSDRRKLRQSI
ncbi:hypothetical protein TorRG33x02_236940, partial [Trema orientale]